MKERRRVAERKPTVGSINLGVFSILWEKKTSNYVAMVHFALAWVILGKICERQVLGQALRNENDQRIFTSD